ncbi:hypothetical protein MKW98_006190 [Papaver atlanticum]|uniref:BTB domain-containing protein n=1 Tax=Papaver atlanticum TaxID=357466 RepID=A0AAD4TH11_9MAGN|nr:hypothetical protein MKW98_006190 [Papaver atlanticum]
MGTQTDKVRFDVRGKIFETTATTLASAPRNSVFGAMFDDEWNLQDNKEEYFMDRNPDFFPVLLDLLGTGELNIPPNLSEKLLFKEAHYYGLLEHVRTAKFSEFNCNRLRLASSFKGQSSGNCTAISASPSGGCAVAHSRIVRLYDWTLEEHLPINFNYQIVNNIGWIDSENIVISACKRPEREDSGLALFNSFTAGALCFNSDGKIAASCIGTGIYGTGVWDQVTGKQTDFFPELVWSPLRYPDRIQWLNGRKCLLAANFYLPKGNDSCISLLDLRNKSKVWSWYDDKKASLRQGPVYDAIAMEDNNSICVVNQYDDLGFLDLRSTVEPRYPRLKLHEGQLFSCINDRVSMFCGPDWFSTSSIGRICGGGAIRDFSIGGDRLFALHSEENIFDMWETPLPPNWVV